VENKSDEDKSEEDLQKRIYFLQHHVSQPTNLQKVGL